MGYETNYEKLCSAHESRLNHNVHRCLYNVSIEAKNYYTEYLSRDILIIKYS